MKALDIAGRVQDALNSDPVLADCRIDVSNENGVVTLTGEVPGEHLREVAEASASAVDGVSGIHNRIRVASSVSPGEVQEKIRQALHRNAEIDAERIHVSVEGAKVILRGVVRTWAEAEAAESAAWIAHGVEQVESHLRTDEELAGA
jgi:osmotically-inducible protein OsmY